MSEFIEAAKKLEKALQEIGRIDKEIDRVHKIIGASKDFRDLRVFITDVDALKKSHIHKDVFITETKRLDEKIDKTLDNLNTRIEAINTRIEDLKAIKFWFKRTLLEIALAIWGAIVTLYAAGILKF